MKRLRFTHPIALLAGCIFLGAALSYVLPAGQYERREDPATGRSVVVPGTYQLVESTPVGFFDALVAIPRGMADRADVIFLIFLIGGAFAVVDETGALRAGVGWLVGPRLPVRGRLMRSDYADERRPARGSSCRWRRVSSVVEVRAQMVLGAHGAWSRRHLRGDRHWASMSIRLRMDFPTIHGPKPGRPPDTTRVAVRVRQNPRGDLIGKDVGRQGRLHVLG